ncbi:MAG TPA: hypothetical protein VHY55_12760, partial [Acidimicrobiia bacterium]|nr:hypothetical protein [Acidimicrobiia bacterium]
MSSDHNRAVRTEFRRQSPTFEGEDSFFADARVAGWVARHLEPLDASMLVVEVACGAAHQGESIAPHVGRRAVVDLISADPHLADAYNDIERRRDPSHTRALTAGELERAVEGTGTTLEHTTRVDVRAPVERWLAQASTPPDVAEAIRAERRAELAGGPPTGMRPVDDGGLHYTQTWQITVGRV